MDDDVMFLGERKRRRNEASTSRGRGRKSARGDDEPEEKEVRGARFVARPSSQVLDRLSRAFAHRLYLIGREPKDTTSCTFAVQGATGNLYHVKIAKQPSCDCPDFGRCYTCKHILFVLLKVLKLPRDDPLVWQRALLSSEVKRVLSLSDSVESTVLASQAVRDKFQELKTGKKAEKTEDAEGEKPLQRPVEGDCPVCYEQMEPAGEPVVFCNTCGNNVHKECFQRWSQSKTSSSAVTCIYCRAVWKNQAKPGAVVKSGGYINLASFSEHHRPENTSMEALYPDSYYGRRGGYYRRRYEDEDEDERYEDQWVGLAAIAAGDHGRVGNAAAGDGNAAAVHEDDETEDDQPAADDQDEDYVIDLDD